MLVHVWARPVACPHSQQKAWPQRHSTRLQLRSTGGTGRCGAGLGAGRRGHTRAAGGKRSTRLRWRRRAQPNASQPGPPEAAAVRRLRLTRRSSPPACCTWGRAWCWPTARRRSRCRRACAAPSRAACRRCRASAAPRSRRSRTGARTCTPPAAARGRAGAGAQHWRAAPRPRAALAYAAQCHPTNCSGRAAVQPPLWPCMPCSALSPLPQPPPPPTHHHHHQWSVTHTHTTLPPPSLRQVLDGDFFLVAAKDAFMEAARQFLFENYCRIHQVGGRRGRETPSCISRAGSAPEYVCTARCSRAGFGAGDVCLQWCGVGASPMPCRRPLLAS